MFGNSLMDIEEQNEESKIVKKLDDELEEVLREDKKVYELFLNQISIETNNGYQYSLARDCKIVDESKEYRSDGYCEHFKSCILYQQGKTPLGHKCPFEKHHIEKISFELINELSIDQKKDYIAMQTITDYVAYSLLKYRAFKALSSSSLLQVSSEETKFGTNYKKEVNPLLEIIDVSERNMSKIKKELVATREIKLHYNIEAAKINVKEAEDKRKTLKEMEKLSSIRNNQLDLIIDIED